MVFDSIEDMAESYKDELFRFLDGKREFPMNGSSLDSLCEELVDLIFTRSGLATNGQVISYFRDGDPIKSSRRIRSNRRRINSSFRDEFANALKSIMRNKGVEFKAWDSVDDAMDDIYDNYIEQYYSIDDLYDKGPKALAKEWFEASYSEDEYADDEEQMFTH